MWRPIRPLWFVHFVVMLAFAVSASAQTRLPSRQLAGIAQPPPALSKVPEVNIGSEGAIPTVSVWHPSFEFMCRDFAKQLGIEHATMIHLTPKPVFPSRERYRGDVWVIEYGNKRAEVSASNLPMALRGIRGAAASAVRIGTCYLEDNYFYSTEHVVFITSPDEVRALASAIR